MIVVASSVTAENLTLTSMSFCQQSANPDGNTDAPLLNPQIIVRWRKRGEMTNLKGAEGSENLYYRLISLRYILLYYKKRIYKMSVNNIFLFDISLRNLSIVFYVRSILQLGRLKKKNIYTKLI